VLRGDEDLLDRPILVGKADDKVAKEAVGDETEHTQADNPDEDFVGCHPQARVEDEVAEAGVSSDHLSRDHGGERVPHRQAHARQDKRQGRWECHMQEGPEGSSPEAGRGAELVGRNMGDAHHGVDQYDEGRRVDDNQDYGTPSQRFGLYPPGGSHNTRSLQ